MNPWRLEDEHSIHEYKGRRYGTPQDWLKPDTSIDSPAKNPFSSQNRTVASNHPPMRNIMDLPQREPGKKDKSDEE
jgi:hypothetical protein